MTNNCVVTPLLVEVNNPSIPKLGEFKIEVKKSSTTPNQYAAELVIRNTKACKVRATGGAYFVESFSDINNPAAKLYELNINANTTKSIYVGNVDGYLFVSEKYTLMHIGNEYEHNTDIMYADVSQLEYSTGIYRVNLGLGLYGDLSVLFDKTNLNLVHAGSTDSEGIAFHSTAFQKLFFKRSTIKGNISELQNLGSLTNIYFDGSSINGTASDLAKFPASCYISVYNSKITGSIEDLVGAFVTKGTSSYEGKNMSTLPVYEVLTFGGHHYATGGIYNTFLSWESASKMWLSGGAGSYATCPNVWCRGYTAEEAATKFSGKTVVRVDA